MKITLTTVTFNGAKTISRTIESVLNQTYRDFEYIIIDGLSKDNTVEIAESYKAKFDEKGIPYKIISENDNGMYDALNKGISLAQGEIIGNINCDDWLESDALEFVAETYNVEHFDMFYADLRIIKETGNIIKHSKKSKLIVSRYWNHPTSYFSKEVFKKYRYAVSCMYDDFDLWLKIMKDKDMNVVVKNKVIANFVFGGMSNKKSLKDAIYRFIIRKNIYKKNGYSRFYYIDCFIIEFAKFLFA